MATIAEGWTICIWFNNKVALGNKLQRGFLAWWISKRNQKKEYREEVEEFERHSAKKLKKEYSEGEIGRQQMQGASFSWLGPQKEPKENSKCKMEPNAGENVRHFSNASVLKEELKEEYSEGETKETSSGRLVLVKELKEDVKEKMELCAGDSSVPKEEL